MDIVRRGFADAYAEGIPSTEFTDCVTDIETGKAPLSANNLLYCLQELALEFLDDRKKSDTALTAIFQRLPVVCCTRILGGQLLYRPVRPTFRHDVARDSNDSEITFDFIEFGREFLVIAGNMQLTGKWSYGLDGSLHSKDGRQLKINILDTAFCEESTDARIGRSILTGTVTVAAGLAGAAVANGAWTLGASVISASSAYLATAVASVATAAAGVATVAAAAIPAVAGTALIALAILAQNDIKQGSGATQKSRAAAASPAPPKQGAPTRADAAAAPHAAAPPPPAPVPPPKQDAAAPPEGKRSGATTRASVAAPDAAAPPPPAPGPAVGVVARPPAPAATAAAAPAIEWVPEWGHVFKDAKCNWAGCDRSISGKNIFCADCIVKANAYAEKPVTTHGTPCCGRRTTERGRRCEQPPTRGNPGASCRHHGSSPLVIPGT